MVDGSKNGSVRCSLFLHYSLLIFHYSLFIEGRPGVRPLHLLFLIYKQIPIIAKTIDTSCDIRMFPSIKLSVLNPSIIALANPYPIKYIYVICPANFLLFCKIISAINSVKVTIDSYRNVGCTSIYLPNSYIPILQGNVVSAPYASIFIKFPHLPIACP